MSATEKIDVDRILILSLLVRRCVSPSGGGTHSLFSNLCACSTRQNSSKKKKQKKSAVRAARRYYDIHMCEKKEGFPHDEKVVF